MSIAFLPFVTFWSPAGVQSCLMFGCPAPPPHCGMVLACGALAGRAHCMPLLACRMSETYHVLFYLTGVFNFFGCPIVFSFKWSPALHDSATGHQSACTLFLVDLCYQWWVYIVFILYTLNFIVYNKRCDLKNILIYLW